MIFDPANVRRARITITSPKPEIERQVWKIPPLRLKYNTSGGYTIGQTIPDRKGQYVVPLPNPDALGLVILE